MAQGYDAEVKIGVTADNSEFKKTLADTQAKTEKTVEELKEEYKSLSSSIGGYQSALNKATEEYGNTSEAAQKYTQKLEEQRKKQEQVRKSLESMGVSVEDLGDSAQDSVQKAKTAFLAGSVAIGNIISGLVTKIASAGKGLIEQGVAYNAQIETYRTGLTNMLGDAEKANTALENIKQDAARTPFDTASLVKANQYLIGAGENAAYSRKTILALGDAVSATGGTSVELERMAQNLQQVANVGKASSVDIKQFAFAGINIYQVLADYTGKSIQDVQDMTISYDLLTKSLQAAAEEGGRYYNSMETQSETFKGSLSTLKDNVSQLLGTVTEGLSSGLGEWMQSLNQTVIDLNEGIQNGTINFEGMFSILGAVAGALLTYKTYTTASTVAQNLLNAAMNANPIGIVVSLLGALAGAFVTAYTTSETFRKGVSNAFQAVKTAAQKFISPAISLVKNLLSLLDRASFAMNKVLGKNAVSQYSNYDEYLKDKKQKEGGHARRNTNQDRRTVSSGGSGTSGGTGSGIVESSIPSSTGGSGGSPGSSSTKEKARQVTDTVTDTQKTIDGSIKTVTKLFNDGTKQVTTTTTKAGKEMVNGVERNVTTVTTKVDEFANEAATVAKETSTTVQKEITDIEEQAVKSLREVEKELKQSFTSETSEGILGILKDGISNIKNQDWGGIALDVVKLIWGEVDAEQRTHITAWAGNVLKVINDEYASGGLSGVGNTLKTLLSGGNLVLNTEQGATTLDSFSKIISDLTASGGMGEVLGSLVTKLGAGFSSLAGNIGSVGTALSGLATKLVAVIAANPEIFAILAIVAGITALGVYIWKKHGKEISGWWSGLWEDSPTAAPASNYKQSDSITAAKLVQASQAAAAANQQNLSSVQNSTGSAAAAQLNASWSGSSTTVLNIDGREVARTTAPYMDEELSFRS
nr:MAG TPA: tail tape measure protein [Caudoviricetes sp.]